MFTKSTRGAHAAPKPHRWFGARATRPACGPVPQLPEPLPFTAYDESAAQPEPALDRPSMDLPAGHMAQRPETDQAPGPVYVGTLLSKASSYRKDDVIVATCGLHIGRRGIVESAYGVGHLRVDIDGATVYLHADEVQLVRRPSDEDTETFANVHVTVPVTVVHVEQTASGAIGYWLPGAPLDDTLTLDAGDVVLMGGAR